MLGPAEQEMANHRPKQVRIALITLEGGNCYTNKIAKILPIMFLKTFSWKKMCVF